MTSASHWFESKASAIHIEDARLVEALWNKFVITLSTEEPPPQFAVFGEEEAMDWATRAINSPAGNLAQLLMRNKGKDSFELNEGMPEDWLPPFRTVARPYPVTRGDSLSLSSGMT